LMVCVIASQTMINKNISDETEINKF
jgi:hypothetical protein